ncbi:MAG: hypothetical protein A2W91_13120 [Bacteroidetes bacterium GWF2_38_335]|nr:MAG: hypothetical protein A2W91_13120 [Bacteroidetes bacterium GWF2_38_335]OFY77196.1 MAG: hypothetical protein A2281_14785 [Bacteroidetes bacterium RIFOXYA12_FULL_38_20]
MDTKITITGAGVVGLAIAAELSKVHGSVFVIEKHPKFGQETSSRNSEVIHSGIYYPKGSLKAKLCVKGKELLYDYCLKNEIGHRKCGKLIVATSDFEAAQIEKIYANAKANGVTDSRIIEKDEILSLEPNINAIKAIHYPSTGIIDSHGLMKQLETDAVINGTQMVYGSEVTCIKKIDDGYAVTVTDSNKQEYTFTAEYFINSAGLFSDKIAEMLGLKIPEYELSYWKGEYFSVGNGKGKMISGLVYPVPESNTVGLGIHATLDLSHRMKLGPSAEYLPQKNHDYSVDKNKMRGFYESAVRFLPFIEPEDLCPDQCGIRPKLQKPGEPARDFIICEETSKGFPGFINLIGIESPGLTSCLAIAEFVGGMVGR